MKKRKDLQLQHFHYEFPFITPSNSSRKSRRLDAELCTIMEEEEEVETNVMMLHEDDPVPGHVAAADSSEERAIVLYDPSNTPLMKSPSSPELSIVIKADLIPGLKDYLTAWGFEKPVKSEENEMRREKSSEASNDCLAVVPWVASDSPTPSEEIVPETGKVLEEDDSSEMMEMDEPYVNNDTENAMEISEKVGSPSPSPWQQPHCMMVNVLQNASTPIRWC